MEQKNKSTLALMEQAIMILVFAFTAAFCVQAFVKAELLSRQLEERDRAVSVCQTAAETVKALHGNMEKAAELLDGSVQDNALTLFFDENWERTIEEKASYVLRLYYKEESIYLAMGEVTISKIDGEEIFSLPVNWQREVAHE